MAATGLKTIEGRLPLEKARRSFDNIPGARSLPEAMTRLRFRVFWN